MSFWVDKPLHALDRGEWEALCDGCGRCCIVKLEDEVTGAVHHTNVACRLLDRRSARCTDYPNRKTLVPDCVQLRQEDVSALDWLPDSCAYRLRAAGLPLKWWHPLVSGDPESVHRAGVSVRGWTVSELEVGDLEDHVLD